MTQKTLPEIYREAADLVLKAGKVEGEMKMVSLDTEAGANPKCFGFCTMGAVFEVAGGILDEFGDYVRLDFDQSPEFLRLAGPVADQIAASGRRERVTTLWNGEDFGPLEPNSSAFWTIASWNDGERGGNPVPTAEEIARLLHETAEAVENKEVSANGTV